MSKICPGLRKLILQCRGWDITWMSDQSVHLARWTLALEQVTVFHLVKCPCQLTTTWSSASQDLKIWQCHTSAVSQVTLSTACNMHPGYPGTASKGEPLHAGGLGSLFSPDLPDSWIIFSVFPKLIFHCSLNYFCCLPAPSRISRLLPNYFPVLPAPWTFSSAPCSLN